MRSLGFSELFAAAPDVLVFAFAVLTQLGDPWFLVVGLVLFYWLTPDGVARDPRRTGALLVGLGVGALLLTVGLKSTFALPRPPGADAATSPTWLPALAVPVFQNIATGTGFGFPSGHALGTTVVYGGVAALFDGWNRRTRWLGATAIVATVGLSRLVLGVHYSVDIVVGVAVGLVFLAGTLRLADGRPERVFAVAVAVGLFALGSAAVGGHTEEVYEAVTGLGGAIGGLVAVRAVGLDDTAVSLPAALGGLVAVGGLWGAVATLSLPLGVTLVLSALAVGLVVVYPRLVAAVRQ